MLQITKLLLTLLLLPPCLPANESTPLIAGRCQQAPAGSLCQAKTWAKTTERIARQAPPGTRPNNGLRNNVNGESEVGVAR